MQLPFTSYFPSQAGSAITRCLYLVLVLVMLPWPLLANAQADELLLVPAPVSVWVDRQQLRADYLAQLTMTEAIRIAKRRYPGRVLSAKRGIGRNGQVVYRIKILSDSGEIRTLSIPAGGARRS